MHTTPLIQQVEFDRSLVERYDGKGPRYTSYPTADRFAELETADYREMLLHSRVGEADKPASLYFHLPFCNTICYYCACNKVITKDESQAVKYTEYLQKEIQLHVNILPYRMKVGQIHFGGGTPTFLPETQLATLMRAINDNFDILTDGEYSIEIDPRKLELSKIALLAETGFNRVSVGVQDFDEKVQRAVNRIQSEEQTRKVIDAARASGFRSVSIDLIYGLPFQSVASVMQTIDRVLDIHPDRIALYNYAHLPERFKPQRRIDTAALPDSSAKLDILHAAIDKLTAAGYVYIGMDHFALPDDDLSIAQRRGTLQRNFQGYSTYAESDLLAFGVSGIGKVGAGYFQNSKNIDEYYEMLDRNQLPIERGYILNMDDLLRRSVIHGLMCRFNLNFGQIETAWLLDFKTYFAPEMGRLSQMEQDGLLQLSEEGIEVTPKGRMLIRSIAMVFDRHLREKTTAASYSRLV
ncbi:MULTISPECIES: oxygen-independent coproporphyrinogen III oxidase [Silvimonas]|uniref:oxygen-independent coproporphyrinogen III oxidase n=1 Tax=Silvimonas TaxID=300264 RepID=UPI0024B344CE|nr:MULTISPECIES: oxygen-independent coproporphyrinogen III oxidase [Silvimonas]MDR3428623.1 oxygen-independent coproporphyrinogen III oxidase [Silvimonas sp.]